MTWATPESPRDTSIRTLCNIRWVAIAGQAFTLVAVRFGLGVPIPFWPGLCLVGLSIPMNVWAARRSGDRSILSHLVFDVLQLSVLLCLTGGLDNPFALLLLAPVTISATAMPHRHTAILGSVTILCASALALWSVPLPDLPAAQRRIGSWAALVLGIVFLAVYAGSVAVQRRRVADALQATQVALAREQRMSSLGALAAAVAHRLGNPLGTIAVTAKELSRTMPPGNEWAEDIGIVQLEAERCREILAELGRGDAAASDASSPYSRLPLSILVGTALAPYSHGPVPVCLETAAQDKSPEPMVWRSPELLHGLGNIVQNATQFARNRVDVRTSWSRDTVRISVRDDGPGFPPALLDRLGEPYVSSRKSSPQSSPRATTRDATSRDATSRDSAGSGDHMGLGVFIAWTLLARTGARLRFANQPVAGARVDLVWDRAMFVPEGTVGTGEERTRDDGGDNPTRRRPVATDCRR